jgi:hypothetical protein
MILKGKKQEKRKIGLTILALLLMGVILMPVVNAENEPDFPEYIETWPSISSLDIVIITDGQPQSGPDTLVGVPEDECEMTQTILISQYDIEEIFSMCRFSNVASMSEYKPTMFNMRSVETEYSISGSIAQTMQDSVSRSESIAQARSDIISQAIAER